MASATEQRTHDLSVAKRALQWRIAVRVRILDPDPKHPLRIGTTATVQTRVSRGPRGGQPMYRKVLLCYDGSAEGRRALREGAEVAYATGAEAHLLAICRSLVASSVPEGVTPELVACEESTARELLEEGVRKLNEHGVKAQGSLVIGDPIEHIPRCAARIGADLIVVGHRPRGRLARWWSESQEQTLLDLVSCSILVAMWPEARE